MAPPDMDVAEMLIDAFCNTLGFGVKKHSSMAQIAQRRARTRRGHHEVVPPQMYESEHSVSMSGVASRPSKRPTEMSDSMYSSIVQHVHRVCELRRGRNVIGVCLEPQGRYQVPVAERTLIFNSCSNFCRPASWCFL